MAAFEAAAANADFTKVKDFYLILTDQPGEKSWPIIDATYMLMRKDAPAGSNTTVLKFMDWALRHGQAQAERLAYVPLPESAVNAVEKSWGTEFEGADGKPLWVAGAQH